MAEAKELTQWVEGMSGWANYMVDDEVVELLSKLRARIATFDEAGDECRIKLVAVGDGAVGKTSLLIRFARGEFPETYIPTVFENYSTEYNYKDRKVTLHLWDTAGQEDYDRLRPLSYPGADIILLCFSLVHSDSLESVKEKWHKEVEHFVPNVPTIMVGTKVDLRDAELKSPSGTGLTPVTKEACEKVRNEISSQKCMEVSAKQGTNIKEVFEEAVKVVLAVRKANGEDDGHDDKAAGGDKGHKDDEIKLIRPANVKRDRGCTLL